MGVRLQEQFGISTPTAAIRTISLADWQALVTERTDSTVLHHARWIGLLRDHYTLRLTILAVADAQRIRAAAPFLRTRTMRGRTKLTSLPFTDYAPPLCDDPQSLGALVGGIRDRRQLDRETVVMRCQLPDATLPRTDTWVRHELDLPTEIDSLRAEYPASLRRNLKRAGRSELRFSAETSLEAVHHFYRLHVITRRRLGIPVQTFGFFRALHDQLIQQELGFVGLVRRHDEVVAAAVFLHYHDTLLYKYGASDPGQLQYRPNEFLFDSALELATDYGWRRFDFGVSHQQDAGLRKFKLKWGSTEQLVPETYLVGTPPAHHGHGFVRRVAEQVIRRSPTFVCRSVGALLYPYSQ